MTTQQVQNQIMRTYYTHTCVAGLNITPEIPAMTMSRHIIFGAVIGIISKSIFEEKK